MNRALKGYTARIGKLNFHPVGFSLDLRDVLVVQELTPGMVHRLAEAGGHVDREQLATNSSDSGPNTQYRVPSGCRSGGAEDLRPAAPFP